MFKSNSVPAKIAKHNFTPYRSGTHAQSFSRGEIQAPKPKKTAEEHLDKDVTHAVVTLPVYFNDTQRAATKVTFDLTLRV